MPPSATTARFLLFVAALSLVLLPFPGTLAASAAADPCAAAAESDAASGEIPLCPVRCFRPDPVCGADGVTYWCGCPEAVCAGARVARRGYCEVGAGSAPVSGQALLLVHIVWLFVLGAAVLLGFL
ncbi:uncharacterized protein LOC100825392 [Brachypodium distachyon]|uniref:Kazal-like domain-containing protein n=1 Tax=Brachypodium distachyon TaxID=15368 RepID=I1HSP2_BRADI|nr:uncharacterized protein LOC100825392 [Brachypodium distachyon]KQK10255.1 hypothetical protein BRADI_2g52987v3 [Brachypodium distachyon]|eukprot:XP_010232475.1 uncharacterized protein LOC100825392 [Brachypodium distachyon]